MNLPHLLSVYAQACWEVLREAAPWMLAGFAVAGLLKVLAPEDALARHLGGTGLRPVLKAALLGAPLPLCSCGVLPAAAGLRRRGAGKGATAAFLISTPETGVDSLAVTWALLDPLMTLLRPVSALLTAVLAGLLVDRLPPETHPAVGLPAPAPADLVPAPAPGCGCPGACPGPARPGGLAARLRAGGDFLRDELLPDIGKWLLLGVLAAGLITVLLPPDFFSSLSTLPGGEWTSMLLMLAVGIPLYVCATSSTPVAAALVLKGLSPGAALVFLLAGPATNAATIAVAARILGRRAVLPYLGSIAACSLAMGWLANRLYAGLGLTLRAAAGAAETGLPPALETGCALLLLGLILWSLGRGRRCCSGHAPAAS